MVASIILIGALKLFNKPVEKVQWAGLIMIVLFGGLTIILRDEQFIKLKPTVLYFVLALTLFIPQFFKKYLIKSLLEKQISLCKEHYDRLWVAIKNNIVDVLGSDHAPHLKVNKDKEYPDTPSGMPGVQTIFPVMLDHVNNEKLSLKQLINLMCENPCRIFGIKNKGYIKEGFDADLTIADMNKEVVIKDEMIASKCGWTPFNNYKVKGFPVGTIVNGNLVMSDGKIVLESKGQPLKF